MARIEPLDLDKADARTRAQLEELSARWGETWNISRGLAHNPAILEAFMALNEALDRSGLSATDREVICMEMARANDCHYCVPAHRYVAHQAGVDAEMIERIARGEALEGDGREAVVQRLVRRLVATKGKLPDEDYAAFLDDGVTPPEMIAVVAEIAHCTLTNFFNRLARTELDPFLEDYRD
jgi:uncharacterized peroxidase-related enzyme